MHTPFLLLPSFHSGSQPDYLDGGVFLGVPVAAVFLDNHRRVILDYPKQDRAGGASPSRPSRSAPSPPSGAARPAKSTGTRTGGLTRSASSASCVTRSVTASLLGASTACRAGTAARSTRPSFPSASTATVSLRPPRTTSATPVVRITCALFGRSSPFFFSFVSSLLETKLLLGFQQWLLAALLGMAPQPP